MAHFRHGSCGESYERQCESGSSLLTATPVRTRRRPRDLLDDAKARLIAEALLPGANVLAIARAAGLDPSQLYGWRRKALASGAVVPLEKAPAMEIGEFVRARASGASKPAERVRLSRK
ncbi:transposase [Rhizobium leguminosarum]|nr:transposase [Rhizobium ruizarguesonis]